MTSINENTDVIDTENKVKENDEYSYLKTSGNSTEAFKIEVRNLPKYYGVNVCICILL